MYDKFLPFTDPRLGRHVLHDPRSKGFAKPGVIDKSTWHDKSIRIYDPRPNPNQPNGCCTMVAKAVMFNAVHNRKRGVVLDMDWVQERYVWETQNDEFPGEMPQEDTGSNGLASCKTAQHFGEGGAYYWLFGGADSIVQAIIDGDVVSCGTRWDNDMFNKDSDGRIHLGGGMAGGHQWAAHRYWKARNWIGGVCWWNGFREFWISVPDMDNLMQDDGDAHVQVRV